MKKLAAMAVCLTMIMNMAACGAMQEATAEQAAESETTQEASSTDLSDGTESPAETENTEDAGDGPAPAEEELPAPPADGIEAEDTRRTLRVVLPAYSENSVAWWTGFEEDFEAENEDLNLIVSAVAPDSLEEFLAGAISAGHPPDIVGVHNYAAYAGAGDLVSTDHYSSAELEVKFFEGLWEAGCLDGQSWGIPLAASVRGFYYNMDLFEKAGITGAPATFEDLREACRLIRETCGEEVSPLGLDFTGIEGDKTFLAFAGSAGGFVDAEGKYALNTAANVRALDFMGELVRAGYTNADPAKENRRKLETAFAEGKVAMLMASPSLPALVAESGSDIRYGFAAFPAAEGDTSRAPAGCDVLVTFKDSEEEEPAARNEAISRFLTAFYDDEVYADYVRTEGFLPATFSAAAKMAASDFGVDSWIALLSSCRCAPDQMENWKEVRSGLIKAERQAAKEGNATGILNSLQAEIDQTMAAEG